jgi:NAD+ synthase
MEEKRKLKIIKSITQFIKSEIRARESEGIILGICGGVDSSVAAWLAVSALGPEKVFGLILPDSSVTPKGNTRDAEKLAKKLRNATHFSWPRVSNRSYSIMQSLSE